MGKVHWWRLQPSVAKAPLVVLLGWAQAELKHLAAHVGLYNRLGCDVCAVQPGTLNLWVPALASRQADVLLAALAEDEAATGRRTLLLVAFSGAPKTSLVPLLHALSSEPRFSPVADSLCGLAFDSGPLDFVSSTGELFLAPPGSGTVRRRAVHALAVALDTLLLSTFESQRAAFWAMLEAASPLPAASPILLMYSEDDELAPASRIRLFRDALQRRGRVVRELWWAQSSHVGHLRDHRAEYEAAVRAWVAECILVQGQRVRGLQPTPPLSKL